MKMWNALDEIYKIYMLVQRSDLNISAKFVPIRYTYRSGHPARRELADRRVPS